MLVMADVAEVAVVQRGVLGGGCVLMKRGGVERGGCAEARGSGAWDGEGE